MRLPVLPILLCAFSAAAQEVPERPERLYASHQLLYGSARKVGLAGAYGAIAEGGESMSTNFASMAHRGSTQRWPVVLRPTLAWDTFLRPSNLDVDNDGQVDRADRTSPIALGLGLQIYKVAFGFYLKMLGTDYFLVKTGQSSGDVITASQGEWVFGGAVTLLRDQLVIGTGLQINQLSLDAQRRAVGATFLGTEGYTVSEYLGSAVALAAGFALDVLIRPENRPFRIGLTFHSGGQGQVSYFDSPTSILPGPELKDFFGRAPFSGVVAPAQLSLSGALRLGAGSENFNALSPAARIEYDRLTDKQAKYLRDLPEVDTGRWLLVAQLDAVLPVANAVGMSALIDSVAEAPLIGSSLQLTPRVGVEHLTVPDLRLRGGSYLEPSPFPGVGPRPHLTAGLDLRLFYFLLNWSLSGNVNLARGFQSFGVSLGMW